MAKRLTYEQKEEARQQAEAARIAERVAAFKQKIERERALRVYAEKEAWSQDDRSAQALYEMVHRYTRAKEQLAREIERLQEKLAEAQQRMAANERASWYSNGIATSTAIDIDRSEQEAWTLAESIARMAWATGWYVPDIHSHRDVANRERMLSLRVEHVPGVTTSSTDPATGVLTVHETWRVLVGDRELTPNLQSELTGYSLEEGDVPMTYTSEVLAWKAAARLVGETID